MRRLERRSNLAAAHLRDAICGRSSDEPQFSVRMFTRIDFHSL